MDTAEFLAHVLPLTGPYVIAHNTEFFSTKQNKVVHTYAQFIADDIAQAAMISRDLDTKGENVFFAIGACIKAKVLVKNSEGKEDYKISRAGTNIRGIRSYTMDIDAGVKNGKMRDYPTVEDALAALVAFVSITGLPRPTITTSGFGLHIYWTLLNEVPESTWEHHGKALVALAQSHGLKLDTGRSIDSSSVLRVVGCTNKGYADKPLVRCIYTGTSTSVERFHALLGLRAPEGGILAIHGPPPVDFGNNTKREHEPLDFRLLMENCQALRYVVDPKNQVQGKAAIPEPAWLSALMLAANSKDGRKAAHWLSKHDVERYKATYVDHRFDKLVADGIGPATCAKFQKDFEGHYNADCCNGCPSKGKITSPAVVAKFVVKAPPLMVQELAPTGAVVVREIPDPPKPYVRTEDGIGVLTANNKTGANETVIFCDYDMYPRKLRYDERTKLEDDVVWQVKMPTEGWIEVSIPHTQSNQLQGVLAKRGIYINSFYIPHQANFMTAYMRRLQDSMPREVAYSKCGWRKGGDGFVLGGTLYKSDGTREEHAISHALAGATQGGLETAGDLDTWKKHVSLYARPGNEAYRTYLYSSFGSIFYHLTGQIATCVSASGVTGTGKSTLLEICASIWGDPSRLRVRGSKDGSTRAAAEVLADAMHHLPVWMDEITGRDAKDVADLIFNYSGGKGKIRSTATGGIRNDTATWSNILLVNANSDEYERMSSVFRDSSQHMMRLIQIEFNPNESISKAEGDKIKRAAFENYGLAGHVFIEFCVQHYPNIKRRMHAINEDIDKAVGAKSEERFWTAWIACAQTAAEIAFNLGLIPGFPISGDVEWMKAQIERMRTRTSAQLPAAANIMSEFLDSNIGSTLTVGRKGSSNIDNILNEPRGELAIRYDVEDHTCYVARHVFRRYCIEQGLNFNRAIVEMQKNKVMVRDNVLKVLGAGTQFGKGKVRCMEIDINALGEKPKLAAVNPAAGTP